MEPKIIDSTEDEFEVLKNGAVRLLSVESEIQMLKEDIKQIKSDLKEEGVKVSDLTKAITIIKNNIKRKQKPELAAIEDMAEKLEQNEDIMTLSEKVVGIK